MLKLQDFRQTNARHSAMIKIRKNRKYAVACVSSMGLRITPENRMAVHNSNRFLLQATSAETNVLQAPSTRHSALDML